MQSNVSNKLCNCMKDKECRGRVIERYNLQAVGSGGVTRIQIKEYVCKSCEGTYTTLQVN